MRENKSFVIVLITALVLMFCSCSSDIPSENQNGTLRIVGIGATGKNVLTNQSEVIKFAEYDVYHTMLGLGELGERAGYKSIEYYNFFPEMTIDSTGFEDKTYTTFSDYDSMMGKLKSITQPEDRTLVIVSSHGSYSGTKIGVTETAAYEKASIFAVKKEGTSYSRKDIKIKQFDLDLNSLKGTVVAFVQVCYSGSVIIGDTVVANTDVYPDASVFRNLFDRSQQSISNHVFYICSCPYYSRSVGERNGEHSYFFKALEKGIGMNPATFEMTNSVPAAKNGLLTLAGLTRYILDNGGVYNGTGDLSDVEQFPIVSGASQDLIIFKFN